MIVNYAEVELPEDLKWCLEYSESWSRLSYLGHYCAD